MSNSSTMGGRLDKTRGTGGDRSERVVQSDDAWRQLAQITSDYIGSWDATTNMSWRNQSTVDVFGGSAIESVGWWRERIHPDDVDATLAAVAAAVEGARSSYQIRYRLRRADGDYATLAERGFIVRNAAGEPIYVVGVATDLSGRERVEDLQRENEARLRQIIDLVPHMIFAKDRDGRALLVNQAVADAYGTTVDAIIGASHSQLHSDESELERFLADDRAVIDSGRPKYVGEEPFRDAQGNDRILETVKIPFRLPGVQGDAVLGVAVDVTDRKRTERALRESEERWRIVFEHAPDAYYLHDLDGVIVDVNRAVERMTGYPREQLIGQSIGELGILSPEDEQRAARWREERGAPGGAADLEQYTLLCSDGRRIAVELQTHSVVIGGTTLVLGTGRDITARKRAEEELSRYQARLRSLASEMSLAEERERRRIAGGLHDGTMQNLGVAKIKLAELREQLSAGTNAAAFAELEELLARTIRETRSLVFELSPPVLYELGFAPAVEWLAERASETYGVPCEIHDPRRSWPLANDVEVVLFQGVRELLANAGRHARSSCVDVRLAGDSRRIRIDVCDDGVGFDPTSVGARVSDAGGFGLFSLRERLELMGGGLEIDSGAGRGTRITLTAPLAREKRREH